MNLCHRCLRPALLAPTISALKITRAKKFRAGGVVRFDYYWNSNGGGVAVLSIVYHKKCVPPILFHDLAGSSPAGAEPIMNSLIKEQVMRGSAIRNHTILFR